MSVAFEDGAIVLVGNCDVGEAETLVRLIQDIPEAAVDVSQAGAVHTALWQVLMALSPLVTGKVADPFVQQWIISQFALKTDDAVTQLAPD